MGWALTEVDNTPTYLGKWGHRMLAWTSENDQGEKEPALYLIAGDAVGGGSFVSDVFVSTETRKRCYCLQHPQDTIVSSFFTRPFMLTFF